MMKVLRNRGLIRDEPEPSFIPRWTERDDLDFKRYFRNIVMDIDFTKHLKKLHDDLFIESIMDKVNEKYEYRGHLVAYVDLPPDRNNDSFRICVFVVDDEHMHRGMKHYAEYGGATGLRYWMTEAEANQAVEPKNVTIVDASAFSEAAVAANRRNQDMRNSVSGDGPVGDVTDSCPTQEVE